MTDRDRFTLKAETAASETERAAWLAAADAAGERDRLMGLHVIGPKESDCWYALLPDPHEPHEFDWFECETEAEAVAAVRRAAGLDAGGESDAG